jgi:tetratricopeptide (TPR) repeat protein
MQLLKMLGECQVAAGQYATALESFQQALECCGEQVRVVSAYKKKGKAAPARLVAAKQYAEALELLQQALECFGEQVSHICKHSARLKQLGECEVAACCPAQGSMQQRWSHFSKLWSAVANR